MTTPEPNEFEFQFADLRWKGRGHWPSIVAAALTSVVVGAGVYVVAIDPGAITSILPSLLRR